MTRSRSTDNTYRQKKSSEWTYQWSKFRHTGEFLFEDWIKPVVLEDFRGKEVLDAGCGSGQHTCFVAPLANHVTAADLNTTEIAKEQANNLNNIDFVEADIATMDLGQTFDIVYCIGVIHHTDNPSRTFENLYQHVKPGGTLIIWTYSSEGNFLVRYGVEPFRKLFLQKMSRQGIEKIAMVITAFMYPIVYSVYRIELFQFLPFFDYFKNFRRLTFEGNLMNVFDKLNAPQTIFTTRSIAEGWFCTERFRTDSISINHYAGVSYSLVGIKRAEY